jgi:hypothetical protein
MRGEVRVKERSVEILKAGGQSSRDVAEEIV